MGDSIHTGGIIKATAFQKITIPRSSITIVDSTNFQTSDTCVQQSGMLKKGGAIYVATSTGVQHAAFIRNVSVANGVATVTTSGWNLTNTTGDFVTVPTGNIVEINFNAPGKFMEDKTDRSDILTTYMASPFKWKFSEGRLVYLEMRVAVASSSGSDEGTMRIAGTDVHSSLIALNETANMLTVIDTPTILYDNAIDLRVRHLTTASSDAQHLTATAMFVIL